MALPIACRNVFSQENDAMSKRSDGPSPDELDRRLHWFEWYTDTTSHNSIHRPPRNRAYACPCCGYLTLRERGGYEICPVCFWEDDGQDEHDARVVRGGPNGALSLSQARRNFAAFGANRERDLPHVRDAHPEEHPLHEEPRSADRN
ncbi:CPCC family cysteine-rich protein [Planotetraspora sp. A-T 1434]|uniref:CPCC family cysteine-rich protein n=1 Tax=Planotetraspora sp. A-T 1434 TaxID=2979219 RepID=UPI0021C1619A|nr:CPCC family cysteine-rich protein [Planotetraspora sp. A-T 1434]MCT9934740.1 CPCC family cysteine-rich protein [Planotetraspora sp. A-T 1434]